MSGNIHNSDDKDIDDSSQKLRQTLADLKKVKHLQEQTEKMNKINSLLNKIHGKSDDNHAVSMQKIASAQQKYDDYAQKINNPDGKNKLLHSVMLPIYYCGYYKNNLEIKYFEIYDFVRSTLLALFLALFIRSFIFQPFSIPSESMLPTLVVGDYLFVSKYAYGYSNYSLPFAPNLFSGRVMASQPKRGDVVVFRVVDDGNKDYIKRIVGLPGDKIQYQNGRLWINGVAVPNKQRGAYTGKPLDINTNDAPIIQETLGNKTYNTLDVYADAPLDNTQIFTVPAKHYFVSGDNRDNSQDSRIIGGAVGFVPEERLVGRAEWIFFSLDRASFFEFWKWPSAIRFERIFTKIE